MMGNNKGNDDIKRQQVNIKIIQNYTKQLKK